MKLYHFTDKKIKDSIKPSFFGENSYTEKDKEASGLPRAFFFTEDKAKEYRFINCKYKYKININKNKLYNLKEDSLGLILKSNKDINKLLEDIKSKGYLGALYSVGYDVVVLFYDVKV